MYTIWQLLSKRFAIISHYCDSKVNNIRVGIARNVATSPDFIYFCKDFWGDLYQSVTVESQRYPDSGYFDYCQIIVHTHTPADDTISKRLNTYELFWTQAYRCFSILDRYDIAVNVRRIYEGYNT